jgi:hypothetical protein
MLCWCCVFWQWTTTNKNTGFITEMNSLTSCVTTSFWTSTLLHALTEEFLYLFYCERRRGKKYFFSLFPIYLPHFKTVLALPPPLVIPLVSSSPSLIHTAIISIPFRCSFYGHSLHLILETVESWVSPHLDLLSLIVTVRITKVFPYNRRARCFFRAGRNQLQFICRNSRKCKQKMHKTKHH